MTQNITFILGAWAHADHGYPLGSDLPKIIKECIIWDKPLSSVLNADGNNKLFNRSKECVDEYNKKISDSSDIFNPPHLQHIDKKFEEEVKNLDKNVFSKIYEEYELWYADKEGNHEDFQTIDQYVGKKIEKNIDPKVIQIKKFISILFNTLDTYAEYVDRSDDRYEQVLSRILQYNITFPNLPIIIYMTTFNYDSLTKVRFKQFQNKVKNTDQKSSFDSPLIAYIHWIAKGSKKDIIISPMVKNIDNYIINYKNIEVYMCSSEKIFVLGFGFHSSILKNIENAVQNNQRPYVQIWSKMYINNYTGNEEKVVAYNLQAAIGETSLYGKNILQMMKDHFHIHETLKDDIDFQSYLDYEDK